MNGNRPLMISFKDLPLYSYDYDANYPRVATEFKNAIAAVDAVLFVTPEYNRSIPGGLKNAIDWASRPYGKNAFARNHLPSSGRRQGRLARRSRNNTCGAFWRSAIRHR
jgi:chromate reductase, NAD(P)H dehydrogenase (quinone)